VRFAILISTLSCNDLQILRMPTVLCYVLCLTSVSGFESHSLSHTLLSLSKQESLRDTHALEFVFYHLHQSVNQRSSQ